MNEVRLATYPYPVHLVGMVWNSRPLGNNSIDAVGEIDSWRGWGDDGNTEKDRSRDYQ